MKNIKVLSVLLAGLIFSGCVDMPPLSGQLNVFKQISSIGVIDPVWGGPPPVVNITPGRYNASFKIDNSNATLDIFDLQNKKAGYVKIPTSELNLPQQQNGVVTEFSQVLPSKKINASFDLAIVGDYFQEELNVSYQTQTCVTQICNTQPNGGTYCYPRYTYVTVKYYDFHQIINIRMDMENPLTKEILGTYQGHGNSTSHRSSGGC